jgi:hypothetical protein
VRLIGDTAADPAQVSFNPDGSLLVVTEKAGNRLDTYTVDENGLPSAPIDNPSNRMTPFGFAFNNPGFFGCFQMHSEERQTNRRHLRIAPEPTAL